MTSVTNDSPEFRARVLEWLRAHHPDVASVERVVAFGNDWLGSTREGFREGFGVDIEYTGSDGKPAVFDVDGPDMASLWMHVVGGKVTA
jgi:hypothetical protein